MKKLLIVIVSLTICFGGYGQIEDGSQQETREQNLEWWREARFGMFIHWGLYSIPAGRWNDKKIDGIGEWIQNFAQIPNSEYDKLMSQFNPHNYNPEQWVLLAKKAGAKYIVFTTKHHEGFCMFPSKVSDFDVESTPYKEDPLKQLVDACHKHNIKVGFYYSHRQDWHEESAVVMGREYEGHFGVPKSELKPDLDRYITEKAIPQIKELLTNYGTIDLFWFDTPFDLNKEQSKAFANVVRELQPNCLINGRVGYNLGDYGFLGDNEMPCARATTDLEMVATLNHTWGYKKDDNNWKDRKDILCSLIECASRGINYMVNIGPTADGVVPQSSIDILGYVKDWMNINSEAIYGSKANPFTDNFPWGYVTQKKNNLFLHLVKEPLNKQIVLKGVRTKIVKANILGDNNDLIFKNGKNKTVLIPDDLDYGKVPVVKVSFKGNPKIIENNYSSEGVISIPARTGKIVPGEKGVMEIADGGNTVNFNENTGKLLLSCTVDIPGTYTVKLYSSRHWRRSFTKGTYISLKVGDHKFIHHMLTCDHQIKNVRENSYPEVISNIGTVKFKRKGSKQIELSIDKIGTYDKTGFYGEDLRGESDNNLRVMKVVLVKQ